MIVPEAPHKTIRLGVTEDESILCVGFAPYLVDHELEGLPQPYHASYGEAEAFGWPRQQIFSQRAASEMVIVALRQTLETDVLRATVIESDRLEKEADPYLAYKRLAEYATKVAKTLRRQLVPVWFEAVPVEGGNGLEISSKAKTASLVRP